MSNDAYFTIRSIASIPPGPTDEATESASANAEPPHSKRHCGGVASESWRRARSWQTED